MDRHLSVGAARHAVPVRLVTTEEQRRPRRGEAGWPRGFKAELGDCSMRPDGTLLLGLGTRGELRRDQLRTAGARLGRAIDRLEIESISLGGFDALPSHLAGEDSAAQALAEGIAIGRWRPDGYAGAASNRSGPRRQVLIDGPSAEARRGLDRGLLLGSAVNEARRIAATPPNVCNPQWIAAESRRLAKSHNLRCRVIGHEEARRLGMGGLSAVGRGSSSPPCLVVLEHRPSRPRRSAGAAGGSRKARPEPPHLVPHLVLVGKTITFDTGGYSLKANPGMRGMKYDKCGGAAVMGVMAAIAEARLPLAVTALLPAAENMISGGSYRPDDIVTLHNGVTVEITNTDAEGRLVLADALAYACRRLKPTAIVDIATLTGGVVVALGTFSAGFFCNDEALRRRIDASSQRTGEKVWQLPLWPEHREFMRSQQADILNSNPKREAQPIQGAAFLSFFVDSAIPWAHLDIAGVNAVEGQNDLVGSGPTGWGVRLLFDLAQEFAR